MADELGNTPTTTVQTPSTASPAAPTVPDDYEQLKEKARYYDAVAEQIGPYYDDYIKPILEDEETRKYTRAAWDARKRQLEAQEPQLSPELTAFEKRMEARFGPMADSWKQQEEFNKKRAEEEGQRAYQENLAYGQRLKSEHPELWENENFGIWSLIEAAKANRISLEESFKRYGSAYARPDPGIPKREAKNYTSGLHGTGQPGIPGESKPVERPRTRAGMAASIAEKLRAGMKG